MTERKHENQSFSQRDYIQGQWIPVPSGKLRHLSKLADWLYISDVGQVDQHAQRQWVWGQILNGCPKVSVIKTLKFGSHASLLSASPASNKQNHLNKMVQTDINFLCTDTGGSLRHTAELKNKLQNDTYLSISLM